MGTLITMRGALEPVEVEDDFSETKHAFELAGANGHRFFSVKRADTGRNIAFSMQNVLFIEETDDILSGFGA